MCENRERGEVNSTGDRMEAPQAPIRSVLMMGITASTSRKYRLYVLIVYVSISQITVTSKPNRTLDLNRNLNTLADSI